MHHEKIASTFLKNAKKDKNKLWQQDFVGEMKIPTSDGFVDKESGSLYFRFDDKLTTGI